MIHVSATAWDRYTGLRPSQSSACPLRVDDKVFGVIELVNKLDGQPFTPLDLKILTTIADFAAIAIAKAYYLRA